MTLGEYFGTEGALTPSQLARLIGKSVSFVTLLRDEKRRPSMDTVDAILEATGGKVSGDDWMTPNEVAA